MDGCGSLFNNIFMFQGKKKIILIIIALTCICLSLFVLYIFSFYFQEDLQVTFCDVGQGDAILIQTKNNKDILVDGGPDLSVLTCLGEQLPFYDRRIELVVLTHPHADHLVGLLAVLDRYQVDNVLITGVDGGNKNYQEFLGLIKEKNINKIIAVAGQRFDLPKGVQLEVIYPLNSLENRKVDNQNNGSVVLSLEYQEIRFLLMGDLEEGGEANLLATGNNLSANVLKLGHHGSSTSSSLDFLQAVDSELVIISVGQGNSFGHPSLRTVKRVERLGSNILRTDLLGKIVFFSVGERVWHEN